MYDSLYGLATRSTHPRLTQRTAKTGISIYQPQLNRQQLPATIVQLHSTTRPTSATRNDHPAAFNDSTDLSFQQRSSSCIQTTRPTSATRNDRPAAFKRLDRPQLPAAIIQLHPTTRPTSATSNNHLAASLRLDHTSYQHHSSS